MDVIIAGGALVVLSPVYLVVWALIRLRMGSPAIFTQERPGLHGEIFTLMKFRTMINATTDASGRPLTDAERVRPLGLALRKASLDELPQLINVLRGEMSLIGPRPLLISYLDKYTPEQMRRHEMRPGITGWAQVNGRNATRFSDRFKADVWYVDHYNLLLDVRIIWLTAWQVVKGRGVQTGQNVADFDDLGFLTSKESFSIADESKVKQHNA